MSKLRKPEQLDLLPYIGKWLVLASAVALLAGSASALFLFSLDHATQWRETHRWAIWLLPVTGFAVGLVYHLIGKPVDAGIGFVAVFAGAANTPLATIVMAMELFGPEIAPLAAIARIASYLVSAIPGSITPSAWATASTAMPCPPISAFRKSRNSTRNEMPRARQKQCRRISRNE